MFGLGTNYIIGWFQNLVDLLNIWERSSLFDRVVLTYHAISKSGNQRANLSNFYFVVFVLMIVFHMFRYFFYLVVVEFFILSKHSSPRL